MKIFIDKWVANAIMSSKVPHWLENNQSMIAYTEKPL